MNKKDCIHYASGGYCCKDHSCKLREKCHTIGHCGGFRRTKCHLKTESDKCIVYRGK
jgi:hypothetical protein